MNETFHRKLAKMVAEEILKTMGDPDRITLGEIQTLPDVIYEELAGLFVEAKERGELDFPDPEWESMEDILKWLDEWRASLNEADRKALYAQAADLDAKRERRGEGS